MAAKRYSQPAHLVYKVMTHLLTDYECVENGVTLTFSAPLYHLLQYIPAKRILSVLKYDGHESFTELASYSLYLEDPTTALYSLSDLQELIPMFRSHLIEGTEYFEKTGYPHKQFKESPWLNALLNKLYFVKWPSAVTETNGKLIYTWVHQATVAGAVRSFSYDRADFMLVFKKNDAERLESMRRKIHQLKLNILAVLSDSLKSNSLTHVWSDSLEILSKSLEKPEVDFLIRMDKQYEKCRLQVPKNIANTYLLASGGILDTFQLIHDVELELRHQTFSTIIGKLSNIVTPTLSHRPRISSGRLLTSAMYLNRSKRRKFVGSTRQLLNLREGSSDEFRQRLMRSLKTEFGAIHVLTERTCVLHKRFIEGRGDRGLEIIDEQGDTKRFKIMQDDVSVVYGQDKYCLPDKFYIAVRYIARQHLISNPWVIKHAVYEECDVTQVYIQDMSVRRWFLKAGGSPERFARNGLIVSRQDGACRIPIPVNFIEIIPGDEVDSPRDS